MTSLICHFTSQKFGIWPIPVFYLVSRAVILYTNGHSSLFNISEGVKCYRERETTLDKYVLKRPFFSCFQLKNRERYWYWACVVVHVWCITVAITIYLSGLFVQLANFFHAVYLRATRQQCMFDWVNGAYACMLNRTIWLSCMHLHPRIEGMHKKEGYTTL